MQTKTDFWQIYQDLCRRIESLYTARAWMLRHLIAYMAGMAALRSMVLVGGVETGGEAHIAVLLAGIAWTAGLLIHLTSYVMVELQERAIAAQVGMLAVEVTNTADEAAITLQRDIAPVQFFDEHGRIMPNGRP